MIKTDWKNKLKAVLEKDKFSEVSTKTQLTKTDETQSVIVSSVFVSGQLRDISRKNEKINSPPICSNCGLELNLIENNTLWFCQMGCEKREAK